MGIKSGIWLYTWIPLKNNAVLKNKDQVLGLYAEVMTYGKFKYKKSDRAVDLFPSQYKFVTKWQ